jgi:hypothetical protein
MQMQFITITDGGGVVVVVYLTTLFQHLRLYSVDITDGVTVANFTSIVVSRGNWPVPQEVSIPERLGLMVIEGRFLMHSLQVKPSRATRCTNAEDLLSNYVEYRLAAYS